MSGDRRSLVYSPQPLPPRRPAKQPASVASLLSLGCLSAILAILLGTCGAAFLILNSAMGEAMPAAPIPDPGQPDITISIQERFFAELMAASLPEEWASQVQIDMKPDNRVEMKGRVQSSFLGQKLEGDVAATVILVARDGELHVALDKVEVLGFALSGIGQSFTDKLLADIDQFIAKQVKDGLGQNAYIMSVASDEEHLIIQTRLR